MKALFRIFSVFIIAVFLGGCVYNFIVPEEVPVIDPDDPDAEQISFASDIQPIFDAKCVACHKTGGQLPDLSSGNAFSSINSTRYLNSTTATESLIYKRANPSNTDSHPKYSEAEAAYVLGWIQQGAKNN